MDEGELPAAPQADTSVSLDTAVFVFSLFDTGALLFLLVYYVSFLMNANSTPNTEFAPPKTF